MLGKEISAPSQNIENSSHKQSGHARSSGKENHKTSRKRGRSVTDKGNNAPKRARMDVNVTSNEDSEFPSDLQDEPRQDELHNAYQTNRCIPHQLIRLMYQLDLSVLCSLRGSIYKHKYPSLSLAFEDSEINKFSNIVLRYKEKSIHIQVENVDNYIDSNISYARLFNKERQSSSINSYFDSFVKHLTSKSDSLLNNIEYFIIYTNSGLDLTEEKKLKKGQSRNFYPFKFDSINIKEYDILKDFLFTNDNTKGSDFYRFLQDKTTREELLKRLEFSSAMKIVIKERKLSQKEIKERFLDKLVFAVNQPNREELNSIIKNEIKKNSEAQGDYIGLQEKILCDLTASEKQKKFANYIFETIYEFNLLMLSLHDMFLHKNIFSINSERKSHDITVNQPNKEKLNSTIKNEIEKNNRSNKVPYNYEELHEIALRWSESHEFGPITKVIMEKLLGDIKNNRSSYKEIQNKNIDEEIKFAKSVAGREDTPRFNKFLDFLIKGEGRRYLEILKREGINLSSMSSILGRAGANAAKAFKDLYDLWFDAEENKTQYLKTLEKEGINLSNMSSILGRAGANAAKAFKDLYDLWFDGEGNQTQYLKTLEEEGINLSNMSNILHGIGANAAAKAFKDLYDLWFDGEGNQTQYLKTLEEEGINLSNISSILGGSGAKAPKAFKGLYDLWFDGEGNKTQYLKTLEEKGINLSNISSILGGSGAKAPKAFKELYDLWFDGKGNKTQYLKTLEEEGTNLSNMSSILNGVGANAAKAFKELYNTFFDKQGKKNQYLKALEEKGINLSNISGILDGAGAKAAKAFKDLYDLWFDGEGNKTQYLKTLEEEGINLSNMSSILGGSGAKAPKAFKGLYDLWFDGEGNQTQYLKTLEEEGVNLSNMSNILNGAGINAAKAFKDLYDLWFDGEGNQTQYLKTLEEEGINLSNISSVLSGAGAKAAKAFKDLHNLWFGVEENQTQYLKILEKEGINLASISSILSGAGANAPKAFKDLYDFWFDAKGTKTQHLKTLEEEGIDLSNISSILHGAGTNATKAFKELYNTFFDEQGKKTRHLKHFIEKKDEEKSFMPHNLSGILSGAGAKTKDAFEKLHSVCFHDKGKRTELLDDFYNAGFRPGNLSCVLCGAGIRASSILKRLHSVCFNEKREKTKLLDDFYNAGFSLDDLCNALSAAADSLEKFHDFCFIGETKKYLNHFLKEGFTPKNLSKILHGARANLCSALKDLHDVCFDETGNKTQFLDDFYKVGFKPSNLSNILSMAGNNASSIFRNFHKSCFNKENYLNHFLAEKKLFAPKNLSQILDRVGLNICPIFEKLHDLCFDKAGNKTNYLNNLIKNNPSNKILNILYKKVRKAPATFLDEQNIGEEDKTSNAPNNSSARTEQERNLDSLQQGDSKAKRKTRKSTTNQNENGQETTDGIDDNPETYFSDATIDNQLTRSPSF